MSRHSVVRKAGSVLVLWLLLLVPSAWAEPNRKKQDHVWRRESGSGVTSMSYAIIGLNRVRLTVSESKKKASKTVYLHHHQVVELKQAFEESFPLATGVADRRLTLKDCHPGRSSVLTFLIYGDHRRRTFLLSIKNKRRGKVPTFIVSKSEADLKRFRKFLTTMEVAARHD